MTRINTDQAATARPELVALADIPTGWVTVVEANDYSIPDTTGKWPERDPLDSTRRIQHGQALVEAPLMFYNKDPNTDHLVEVRILTEGGDSIQQLSVRIPPLETYAHPAPGQILTKKQIGTTSGDALQVKADASGAIDMTTAASFGSAEQDLPA